MYCTTNYISIDSMFKGNFPTVTQVSNSLSHRNDRQQIGVICVTYECYNSKCYTRNIRVIRRSRVPHMNVSDDNQLIATRHSCEVKRCNAMIIGGYRTQPLLMMAIHHIKVTHKQERGTHILSLHGSH